MAKQTFTTGQVLTAAQMTSLQQTAMLGGAASAKTASYTLVAADAGTAITMSNASATTITVNTALFEAGDTVQITNLGAGVCTITAGTATVNSSASLALAQYESGTLDFTSTSAAIFIKGAGAAASTGGQNWSLVNSGGTALSGSGTVTISGISNADAIMVVIREGSTSSASQFIRFRVNSLATGIYNYSGAELGFPSAYAASNGNTLDSYADSEILLCKTSSAAADLFSGGLILRGSNSAGTKMLTSTLASSNNSGNGGTTNLLSGFISTSATISSVQIRVTSGTFDAGTIYVYTTA